MSADGIERKSSLQRRLMSKSQQRSTASGNKKSSLKMPHLTLESKGYENLQKYTDKKGITIIKKVSSFRKGKVSPHLKQNHTKIVQ